MAPSRCERSVGHVPSAGGGGSCAGCGRRDPRRSGGPAAWAGADANTSADRCDAAWTPTSLKSWSRVLSRRSLSSCAPSRTGRDSRSRRRCSGNPRSCPDSLHLSTPARRSGGVVLSLKRRAKWWHDQALFHEHWDRRHGSGHIASTRSTKRPSSRRSRECAQRSSSLTGARRRTATRQRVDEPFSSRAVRSSDCALPCRAHPSPLRSSS